MISKLDNDTPTLNASPHWVAFPSMERDEISVGFPKPSNYVGKFVR